MYQYVESYLALHLHGTCLINTSLVCLGVDMMFHLFEMIQDFSYQCRSPSLREDHVRIWLNQHNTFNTDGHAVRCFMSWPTSALPTKDLGSKMF